MRIIAESEEEKQEILKVSRYLHDLRICQQRFPIPKLLVMDAGGVRETLTGGQVFYLDLEEGVGDTLRHLYCCPAFVEVEETLSFKKPVTENID